MNRPESYIKQQTEFGFTNKCASCDWFVYEPTKKGDGYCRHRETDNYPRSHMTHACFNWAPFERMRI